MAEDMMAPADIAAVMGGGRNDWGDNSFMWIFALLILMFGGNGFFGNNRGNSVTEADLCNANSFNELKGSVGRLNDQVSNAYTGLQNGLCNLGYTSLENFNSTQRQISDCCCTTQRAIDATNYNLANVEASINANTTAQTQKVLDALCQNKMEALQNKVNSLELQSALAGVVRYPSAITYNGGSSPFCANTMGCCGGCSNI